MFGRSGTAGFQLTDMPAILEIYGGSQDETQREYAAGRLSRDFLGVAHKAQMYQLVTDQLARLNAFGNVQARRQALAMLRVSYGAGLIVNGAGFGSLNGMQQVGNRSSACSQFAIAILRPFRGTVCGG